MEGVSVIIPTYNREKYISEAINSVLNQDYRGELEVIVSDDGSTDNTATIAKSFGRKVIFLEKSITCNTQGASGARNRGLRAATKNYICFLDSDDYFLPGHIKKMVNIIKKNPDFGFAFCRLLETDETDPNKLFRPWTKSKITKRDITNLIVSKHNVVQTNGFIFKSNIFIKTGLFNEKLTNGEDTDLWIRVIEHCNGAFSNHFGGVIRKHNNGQLTNNSKEIVIKNSIEIYSNAIKRNLSFRHRNIFRILKLIYMYCKYKAFTIPHLYNLHIIINSKKRENKKSSWHKLEDYSKQ